MGIMIASSLELLSDPPLVPKRASGAIAFVDLDTIPADGIKPITIDEEPLRTAPPEAARQHLEAVESAVVPGISQTADAIPITNEESAFAVEGDGITAA